MEKWQTAEGVKDLTISLVEYGSVTGSEEEIGIMEFVDYELRSLPYFKEHEGFLQTHYTDDGRKFVTAFVKSKTNTEKTVILMGHLDVVDVEDYGEWKHLAFRPRELTKQMFEQKEQLPPIIQKDLEKDEWLFGRGTMDMKAGIAICMSMVEAASNGEFEGNIVFLAVPDEEVNSTGMRAATPVLLDLAKQHQLKYEVVWNTEPVFSTFPGDEQLYIYQGSLGKMLPGFYCFGEESHVAEPFSGLNGNFMTSYLTDAIELNPTLSEKVGKEKTPPPTSLLQKDLKLDYSVQIPHTAVMIFNLMTMKKTAKEVTGQLLKIARSTAEKIAIAYKDRETAFAEIHDYSPKERKINVFTFQELLDYAIKTAGEDEVERRVSFIQANETDGDERELTIQMVNEIASLCKELAPMIVLFYAPPYYPAVSSEENETVIGLCRYLTKEAKERLNINLETVHYFPGLSDLSYTSLGESAVHLHSLTKNMPLWNVSYNLPLKEMEELDMAVVNFGPLGKDPHSWTERLNVTYSFEKLPPLIKKGIHFIFSK
ncbi:M20/M25/M40 family metallo-hydrolase [Bacillus shivajii]|uniref:M20/M25/M40 family metallo-hydrolase n=1 Tax=Bacillus shivajii TaxID=1983719 RepID=UPI001CF99437|nr:M20/M25/M40 family metallo-hydrolase [Bacillus shivajii]UCZ54650.1 M20/M25/M40 family metallo-hydrolase [Bacillus shivajii]